MVRFKVIKGSHLLFAAAVIILVIAIGTILLSTLLTQKDTPVINQANLVSILDPISEEAKADAAFASFQINDKSLALDPEPQDNLSIEILPPPEGRKIQKPRVLIYHTHTHEAYEQTPGDQYIAIEAWRTTDYSHSVVRVGAELAQLLQTRGFEVTHDVTDHEKDELKTAYTRSLETLRSYDASFDLYIDLHRDAYLEDSDDMKGIAQIMMLIGNGVGFEEKPYYEENLLFAKVLTRRINESHPGLCKDVLVKDGRYNQHIGVFSILVEVGHNKNTLSEALAALPFLADGLESIMITNPDPALQQIQAEAVFQ